MTGQEIVIHLYRNKYRRLDMEWIYGDRPLLDAATVRSLECCAQQSGVNPHNVIATGAMSDA